MKSKKADTNVPWMLVAIVLFMLFLFLWSKGYFALFNKNLAGVKEKLTAAGDYDNDNVINIEDKCPCFAGTIDNEGCPADYKITGSGSGKEIKECPKKS